MRTGSEPTTARSSLRLRLRLSLWGLVWAVFGVTAFALTGRPGWAAACGVLLVVVLVDLVVIVHRVSRRSGRPSGTRGWGREPPRA
ncbi:DUF6343 family protein [Streptomyces sp. DT20]|uniref:DUF6343 family protein n=1 Tax=unclassified Streptomyces TaxID=2593676 RepID=UPI00093CF20D|nr:DUF6343 family protein [Streptomyces sp. CB02488]